MADSGESIAVDMETIYVGGKEHIIRTGPGCLSVIVYRDQQKPPLITYPDKALNHMSCFQGLFFCPEAAFLLLHNFCIYHITPPGHELGAASICPDNPIPSVDDLCDQILEARCSDVHGLILTLFAIRYRNRVTGLILISPLCKAPSWIEWLYNKYMSNLLYYYGMCSLLKENLLQRYFSKEVRGSPEISESDIVHACRKLLNERQSINVLRFLQAIDRRPDHTEGLKRLKCRTLIFVGDSSPFHFDALHMTANLDSRFSALEEVYRVLRILSLIQVQGCGSLVTEEQPESILISMEYFLIGYGLYRPPSHSNDSSPRSSLSFMSVSPELLSPQSMGLNLKPIKTRVSSRDGTCCHSS